MKKATENAMKVLAERITSYIDAGDALKLTQAQLNLAHVLSVVKETSKD